MLKKYSDILHCEQLDRLMDKHKDEQSQIQGILLLAWLSKKSFRELWHLVALLLNKTFEEL